jgi:hypothetical protein
MLDFCAEHGIVADIEMIRMRRDQRGLRAHAQERREVPLRDRHGSIAKLPEGERLQAVQASSQYRDGQFQNEVATPMRTSGGFSVLTAMIGVDLSCATVLRLSHLCQP